MRARALRCLELLVCAGAALGGGWLLLRFVLPGLAPFLLAYLLAALMEPAVRALGRLRLRRAAASAVVTLGLLALLLFLSARLLTRGMAALNELAVSLPGLIGALAQRFDALEARLLDLAREIPGGREDLELVLAAVSRTLTGVPERLSGQVLQTAASAAQRSPNALLFLITAGLGSYFLSASFPSVRSFLLAQLPPERLRQQELLRQELRQSVGGWLRAQMLMALITFAELLAALLILQVPGAAPLAALTALVDALPVFGVGTVLLPWALGCLLLGETGRALGLTLAWALVNLVRSAAQAKLLGDQIGLDPLASLLALYVGWELSGVWGMLLCPLVLVTLCQLNDKGVISLWK